MKKSWSGVALALVWCAAGGMTAAAPKVVRVEVAGVDVTEGTASIAVPAAWDKLKGYDTGTEVEMRITFNAPMSRSNYSFRGKAGVAGVRTVGNHAWEKDDTVFVSKIKVSPKVEYFSVINETGASAGFQAAEGTRAERFEVKFSTTLAGAGTRPATTRAGK